MRFLLDMNLPPSLADWLCEQGHDAIHLRELGGGDWSDREIFSDAAASSRIVVTLDLDFGEIGGVSLGGVGIILLRLRRTHRSYLCQRILVAIAEASEALQDGAIALVEDTRIRIRRVRERDDPA